MVLSLLVLGSNRLISVLRVDICRCPPDSENTIPAMKYSTIAHQEVKGYNCTRSAKIWVCRSMSMNTCAFLMDAEDRFIEHSVYSFKVAPEHRMQTQGWSTATSSLKQTKCRWKPRRRNSFNVSLMHPDSHRLKH